MQLQATIIDKLWNSEYGDHLEYPGPNPQQPSNVRTIDGQVAEIEINKQLHDGLYRLEKVSNPLGRVSNRLDTYRFVAPFHLGFVLYRLSSLIEEGKTKTTVRSVRVDPSKLSAKQKALLEEIFKEQVFNGTWNVSLNATKTEKQYVKIDITDFDKCFSPFIERDLVDNKEKEDWTTEEDIDTNIYLVISNGEDSKVAYNLSELYSLNVIELEDVRELVDCIIAERLSVADFNGYKYSRNVAADAREGQREATKQANHRMRQTNLVNHVASVLSEHNPKFKVTGHGEDYINYHVSEETGEFPYVVEYHAPLWRLSIPGLTEAVVGNSMNKDEALRMITDGFTLETKINPLSEDDIHRLQNQYYIRGMDNVEWGRFTYSVKRDKR